MKFKFDIEKHFQNCFLARIISSHLIEDKNIQRLKGSELNMKNWNWKVEAYKSSELSSKKNNEVESEELWCF